MNFGKNKYWKIIRAETIIGKNKVLKTLNANLLPKPTFMQKPNQPTLKKHLLLRN